MRTAVRPSPSRWFAEQLVEVLSGRRPVHALLGHARGTAFDQVVALAERAPLRPDGADRRAAVLASVRSMRLEDDVIEASARISTGGRERAMAFRLEAGEDRRWRCAAVELG
ncbi:Rv3235 family protein [Streptomyces sp. RKND-216]|uniref:Rv3235 family protein n=1 Tax=Streptomyces sp. RKND-216 TaxID=2562581 RepID=UPI0003FFF7A6|nr:Rv3235 family protein [Streptomyces sp. RKND-216]